MRIGLSQEEIKAAFLYKVSAGIWLSKAIKQLALYPWKMYRNVVDVAQSTYGSFPAHSPSESKKKMKIASTAERVWELDKSLLMIFEG